ncbi:MAG: hypothetical protein NTW51_10620 [Cyanobacteria bacterium]|nr:hypothetical protein [Cyanobacteriota bacterium]
MFLPIQFQVRLVHAESGNRVVEVRALRGSTPLGSALGEAANAEEAEQRALDRLLSRLGPLEEPPAANTPIPAGADPPLPLPAHPPAHRSVPAPVPTPVTPSAAEAPAGGQDPRLPSAPVPRTATNSPPRPGPATTAPAAPPPEAADPPADPEDWSSELARLDLELRRLGWSREQEGEFLQRAYGHPSRSRITSYTDLKAYLDALEGLPPGAEPASSPVPLRRRDLLAQSDQLLGALGWKGEQARQFLEQQLGATSRQQLNDSKLLHFNMLLESELLERDPTGGRMINPPAPPP